MARLFNVSSLLFGLSHSADIRNCCVTLLQEKSYIFWKHTAPLDDVDEDDFEDDFLDVPLPVLFGP